MAEKRVYFFGGGKAEGNAKMKELLGGKGANLAEMTNLGVPVPPGFTIATKVCDEYYKSGGKWPKGLDTEVNANLAKLEKAMNAKLGDPDKPLLVSVRSGAAASMPGMMDTVLNLGLNDEVIDGIINRTGNARFAYDIYRRFIDMFGDVVMRCSHDYFEEVIDEAVARALTDGERPEKLALEPWLYRLSMQAMDEMVAASREVDLPVHLEDSARLQNVRGSDEPELQFHQPDETLTRENVIADRRVATPEQLASSDEMVALVHAALRGVKRLDREAFLLYGIEGFSITEISAITDRLPEDVQASIVAIRDHMKKAPAISSQFNAAPVAKSTSV